MEKLFTRTANSVAHAAGKPVTFLLCCLIIMAWAMSGPIFGFSDTWQLIINTGTTIVTFLMVFLIQNTQNRDGAALQAKLDELIRVGKAQNRFIGIEHLTEQEVEQYRALSEKAAKAADKAKRAELKTEKAESDAEQAARKAQKQTAKAANGPARPKRRPLRAKATRHADAH